MTELVFIKEYRGHVRSAQLFRDRTLENYVLSGYKGNVQILREIFTSERRAEEYAQQWIKS